MAFGLHVLVRMRDDDDVTQQHTTRRVRNKRNPHCLSFPLLCVPPIYVCVVRVVVCVLGGGNSCSNPLEWLLLIIVADAPKRGQKDQSDKNNTTTKRKEQ